MINNSNVTNLQQNPLLVNSNKLGNSTPSLAFSTEQSNGSPLHALNNNVKSNGPQHYTPQHTNNGKYVPSGSQSAELAINKYNHLSQYQQQQNLLKHPPPFNLKNNTAVSQNNTNQRLSMNSSFNNSMAFFRNSQANAGNSIPVSATLNSIQNNRLSAPSMPAPMPPVSLNNSSYFAASKEQDLLDDGFLNLFKDKNNKDVSILFNYYSVYDGNECLSG